jgi:predicted nucleic acid-binding Zn ribbon protein
MSDDPIKTCEKCSGKVRKILFPVGISFKGSGFHVNDYRKPDSGSKEPVAPKVEKTKETV